MSPSQVAVEMAPPQPADTADQAAAPIPAPAGVGAGV
jgi:hypothetical protein